MILYIKYPIQFEFQLKFKSKFNLLKCSSYMYHTEWKTQAASEITHSLEQVLL